VLLAVEVLEGGNVLRRDLGLDVVGDRLCPAGQVDELIVVDAKGAAEDELDSKVGDVDAVRRELQRALVGSGVVELDGDDVESGELYGRAAGAGCWAWMVGSTTTMQMEAASTAKVRPKARVGIDASPPAQINGRSLIDVNGGRRLPVPVWSANVRSLPVCRSKLTRTVEG